MATIDISANRYLVKKSTISLDLASIAEGFAVDQITRLIRNDEIKNFPVEIRGEGFASGFRKDGKHWRAGINRPHKDAPVDQAYKF